METACREFPYSIEIVSNPLLKISLVTVGPKRYVCPSGYTDLGPRYYNFNVRSSDVFLVGYPRSGTTLTQEAIWLLNNNLDYNTAKEIIIPERVPYLEKDLFQNTMLELVDVLSQDVTSDLLEKIMYPLEKLSEQKSPRFFKTHIPLSLLPPNLLKTAKVVYIARDPRDVAVSFYMFLKLKYLSDEVDFKTFWQGFTEGKALWNPHLEHVTEAWNLRSHPNLLFLTYEDMSQDLSSCLQRMANFFGKKYTDDEIQGLCEHLSFNSFKLNQAVNQSTTLKKIGIVDDNDHSFIRKGKVGGWRDSFDEQLKSNAENWMAQKLAGTDLPFTL